MTSEQIQPVRLRILAAPSCRLAYIHPCLFADVRAFSKKGHTQLGHHRLGDIVLHGENVLERPIVRLRPDLIPVRDAYELYADAYATTDATHAAIQQGGTLSALPISPSGTSLPLK